MLDLENAERDIWVLENYAEVRRYYYEHGMLSCRCVNRGLESWIK